MKKLFYGLSIFLVVSAQAASTTQGKFVQATDAEIQQKRNCFEELERQGCAKLDDDPAGFRSCLSQVQEKLDVDCKQMMLDLYGSK